MILNKQKFTAWDRNNGEHEAITYKFDSRRSMTISISRLKKKFAGKYLYYKKKEIDRGSFVDYLLTFHLGEKQIDKTKWANKKNL